MNYNWSDKTILIAEDEQTNYNYIVAVLEKTNANVLWARDGQIALDTVKNNPVSLVLMDIRLPNMSGYDAIIKIKEFDEKLPIIAQTAYAMFNEKDRILKAGCNDYLTKPIRPNLLLETIAKYI